MARKDSQLALLHQIHTPEGQIAARAHSRLQALIQELGLDNIVLQLAKQAAEVRG